MVHVQPGDRLMFCSDGVCGLIDDGVIEAALQIPDLDKAVQRLVVESLHEGGIDNITVIVADVVESGGSDEVMVLGAASDQPIRALGRRAASLPRTTPPPMTLWSRDWPISRLAER
jgi:protein phosphatase